MSAGNNFVDLRISNFGTAGGNEDSIWPAFTDIMTVVLMIFLISLVAFLIRNTELVDELQTALIEKDQISEKALLSAEQNTSLSAQLALVRKRVLSLEGSLGSAESAKIALEKILEKRALVVEDLELEIALLTKLRDQLSDSNSDLLSQVDLGKQSLIETKMEFSDSKNTLNEKISLLLAEKAGLTLEQDQSEQALSDAEAEKLVLTSKLISLTEQLRLINERLDTEREENDSLNIALEEKVLLAAGLSTSKEEMESKLQNLADQLSLLQMQYEARGAIVSDLESLVSGNEQKYKSLQDEYESLDAQYRKLVRPARSSAGKVVVGVYLAKINGALVYRLRSPDQTSPQVMSAREMDNKLAALKAEHQQALYTSIRIDEKSGIAYSEAWNFTQHILKDFDYYATDFQKPATDQISE